MVGFAISAAVLIAILAEFLRGARVISRQTRRNLFAATWLLTRRNTRRYGGYLIHIGVVIVVVGVCGSAFNRNIENEMALNSTMQIGPYTLKCMGFTQDSNANYSSEYAVLDVFAGSKPVRTVQLDHYALGFIPIFHIVPLQMAPEKRFYLASGQPQTMVAIHSVPEWDLYVVYEGTNPSTGQPIIKAFLNPLVGWIWFGLVVIVFGTFVALVPSLTPASAALRILATQAAPAAPALKGGD
jgi:cytochrome c-type biogenesis protein CcmF